VGVVLGVLAKFFGGGYLELSENHGDPLFRVFLHFSDLTTFPPPSMDGFIELRKKYQTIVNVHTRVHGVLIILHLGVVKSEFETKKTYFYGAQIKTNWSLLL
jgi:hypothetical protein